MKTKMMKGQKNNLNATSDIMIGNAGYITQPRTNLAIVKGQTVIAPNFLYKRRIQ